MIYPGSISDGDTFFFTICLCHWCHFWPCSIPHHDDLCPVTWLPVNPHVLSSTNTLLVATKDLSQSKVAIKIDHDSCIPFLLTVNAKGFETLCVFALEILFLHAVIRGGSPRKTSNSLCKLSLLAVHTTLERPLKRQLQRPKEQICSSWR